MNKLATLLLGVSALAFSTTSIAHVAYEDPHPKGMNGADDTGGIGYEWHVHILKGNTEEITGSTGGKGSFEPTFTAPDFGWTHTTDWVALELAAMGVLEIQVTRQPGIYELQVDRKDPTKQKFTTSGDLLYPAMSIYKGWDETAKEKASFNPAGNFWATGLEFMKVEYSKWGETTITYRAMLPAGKYSVNIGGVNALYCKETDKCFNGVHGYRATFNLKPMPMKVMK